MPNMPFVAERAPIRMRAVMKTLCFSCRMRFAVMHDLAPAGAVANPEEAIEGSNKVHILKYK
jgi:hypothetical protein